MWYVVQVPTGREEYMCRLIRRVAEELDQAAERAEARSPWDGAAEVRAAEEPGAQSAAAPDVPEGPSGADRGDDAAHARNIGRVLIECFVPTCAFERKRRGEWHTVRLPLFPGYVVVDSRDVGALEQMLRRVPEFTRVLRMGEVFIPLDSAEVTWIKTFADPDTRSVEMPVGMMEGDKVHVMSGPLRGHEGEIKEVKRRQGVALLEVHMFGRTMTARVGLAIVAKRNDGEQSSKRGGHEGSGSR